MRRTRTMLTVAAVVAAAALLLAACSSSPSTPSASGVAKGTTVPTGGTPQTGGTATWAELPSDTPNFIFPFDPPGLFSVVQHLPVPVPHVPPAVLVRRRNHAGPEPVPLGRTEPRLLQRFEDHHHPLNNYKWSNGETVTAQDVVFWMNMMHAEKDNFGAYVPGINAIPDDVTNVVATSPTEVTFTLSGAVNTNWYTYNNLSQITPMPKAWDITAKGGAPGSGGCFSGAYGTTSTDAACTKVFDFLATSGRVQPVEPQGRQQLLLHLRHQPHLANRRRSVAPDGVRRHRGRHHGAQPHLHGAGEGQARQVHRGAVHRRAHRVQRPARRQAPRRLSAPGQRDQAHHQPECGGGPGPTARRAST